MSGYFKAGGTLDLDAPSYIERPADAQLYRLARAGQLCYVLTTRQMGKSSLMIRTAARLRAEGVRTAIVDLSPLGVQVTDEQWYLGILTELARQLDVKTAEEVRAWWSQRAALGVVQRFSDFLRDGVLAKVPGPIVIFLDEIDSTLKLGFTDDFFAAIRVTYNQRAGDPEYDRLTFVLLGVASPASLIKDPNRTPFNVGVGVELGDFSRDDAEPLRHGLEQAFPGQGAALLDRIFFWTNGHPYLTQKVCQALAGAARESGGGEVPGGETPDQAQVDGLVNDLFLSIDAKGEENLQFVRSRVQAYPEVRPLLQLYRRALRGERLSQDDRSPLQNELRLIGLVRPQKSLLEVRNEIYRRVFDERWIKAMTPIDWSKWVTLVALGVIVGVVGTLWEMQRGRTNQRIESLRQDFTRASTANVRVLDLAEICALRPGVAHALVIALPTEERERIFTEVSSSVYGREVAEVAKCLDPAEIALPAGDREALSAAMCAALCEVRPAPEAAERCDCANGAHEAP